MERKLAQKIKKEIREMDLKLFRKIAYNGYTINFNGEGKYIGYDIQPRGYGIRLDQNLPTKKDTYEKIDGMVKEYEQYLVNN